MANLQVQETFEPYYAGRNSNDNARWIIRRKDETVGVGEKSDKDRASVSPSDTSKN